MTSSNGGSESCYGIGAVARMTGLNQHTIRVWERRYQAVVAGRTATGRRTYTAADVDKLGLLSALTAQGVAISQIASLPAEELRVQLGTVDTLTSSPPNEVVRIAALGDFLPEQLRRLGGEADADIALVVSASNKATLLTDLKLQAVDLLMIEVAVLDSESLAAACKLMRQASVSKGIIVYSFARTQDVEAARNKKLLAVRAPVADAAILVSIQELLSRRRPGKTSRASSAPADLTGLADEIPARRFGNQELAMLARASTSIDCECPQHLAQLVRDLSAFELYSANCSDRNADDAALHAHLHRTTAKAREMMETALDMVARAEGLLR